MNTRSIGWAAALCASLAMTGCDDEAPATTDDAGPAPRVDAGAGGSDGGGGADAGARSDDAGAPGVDAGSGRLPVVASAGCGVADPPSGARTITVSAGEGDYLVSLPSGYEPGTPYPLGFGFHGHGRTHENCQDGDCRGFQDAMEDVAILVYPKSFTDGWPYPVETRDDNVELFEAILDTMVAEYCVDESRVFVAGTSSGATFSNVLACRFGDRLLASVPVAGGLPERDGCVGRVAALVIHGVDDYHVGFDLGEEARDWYVDRNGCGADPSPALPGLHDRVVAERESHECADYPSCDDELAVRWCEHSEGGYDGSTHGWPAFGGDAIWEFVSAF